MKAIIARETFGRELAAYKERRSGGQRQALPGRARAGLGVRPDVRPDAMVDDLTGSIGNAAAAQPGLLLAAALDDAGPDEVVVLLRGRGRGRHDQRPPTAR